jgi:hypothetical protein
VEAEIAVAVGLLPGLTITPSRHEQLLAHTHARGYPR